MLIFFINLPVLDLPTRGNLVIILALFRACVTKYHRRPSLCSSPSLSSLVAALVSLLAFLFPINPKWPGIQYSVILFS